MTTSYLLQQYTTTTPFPTSIGIYAVQQDAINKMVALASTATTAGQGEFPASTFDTITSNDGLSSCVRMTSTTSTPISISDLTLPDLQLTMTIQTYYAIFVITALVNA